jgi:cytochrome P450
MRHTLEPVEYSGVTIPAGEFVLALITSANRDDDRFPDADRLDLSRATGGLLTFGHGIHYCIGAPLARLEGEIAIGRLLRRFPGLRLAVRPDELVWRFSTLIRGLDALPVLLR